MDNNIRDKGSQALAVALQHPSHANVSKLTVLKLSANGIGDGGAVEVARMLEFTPRMKVLKLDRNRIGHVGAGAIIRALVHTPALVSISLHHNRQTDMDMARALHDLEYCRKHGQFQAERQRRLVPIKKVTVFKGVRVAYRQSHQDYRRVLAGPCNKEAGPCNKKFLLL